MEEAGQCRCGKRVRQCLLSDQVQEEKQASVRGERHRCRVSVKGDIVRTAWLSRGLQWAVCSSKGLDICKEVDGAGVPWSHSLVVKVEIAG